MRTHRPRLASLAAALLAATVVYLPLPASACSCAVPGDLVEWVDNSEAVFVGELIEKRPATVDQFGAEAIYVFRVETWVKGDLGEVIEVHSAADGAGCGFEFFGEGMRTGAAIYSDGDRLSGGLCSQVDPDVLLTALRGPKKSETGVPRLLVGGGWASDRMFLLDEGGGLVAELRPPPGADPFAGTSGLIACPGNRVVLQLTSDAIHVWDTTTGTLTATLGVVEAGETKWVAAVSCRSENGAEILAVIQSDRAAALVDVATLEETAIAPGEVWKFGPGFVIALEQNASALVRIDLNSGEQETVYTADADVGHVTEFAVHDVDGRIALLETRFADRGPHSTLVVMDADGEPLTELEIAAEVYAPTWLSDDLVALQAYDSQSGEDPFALVFDVKSGGETRLDGWQADHLQATGNVVYGTRGGEVFSADLVSGTTEALTTLPVQSGGPIVILPAELAPLTTTTSIGPEATPETTVPPLVSANVPGADHTVAPRTVARLAVIVVTLTLIALGVSTRRGRASE